MKSLPPVRIAQNLKLIGHSDLGGYPNAGEGVGIKLTPQGRRIMYLSQENWPMAFTILDVTDPADPQVVWQLPLPHKDCRANSLTLCGDMLLVAYQAMKVGGGPAGFQVYDVSDAVKPKEVSFFDTSGPHSIGVHFVSLMDGRFAHVSTGAADFEPKVPIDHQFYMIVDLENPAKPREVGRWWLPGQRKGDTATIKRHTPPSIDFAFRPHNILCFPERPDRAYIGYIDGGIIILDISDKERPQLISRVDYHPPFPGFSHTVVPLFERGLLVVTDEAMGAGWVDVEGSDWPKRQWILDVREETNPVIIASMPKPEGFDEFFRVGARIGAHNIHENEVEPCSARLQNTVVATWFSAGLRIYDIRDPFRPEEIAAFVPETPAGQRGCRISDVFVDEKGIIYAADRARGGLYILEYTGAISLD